MPLPVKFSLPRTTRLVHPTMSAAEAERRRQEYRALAITKNRTVKASNKMNRNKNENYGNVYPVSNNNVGNIPVGNSNSDFSKESSDKALNDLFIAPRLRAKRQALLNARREATLNARRKALWGKVLASKRKTRKNRRR